MNWRILRNSLCFFMIAVCLFFGGAFGILYFFPENFVLDISLCWQILISGVCLLLHVYIGLFTREKCLFYSAVFNGLLWLLWIGLLIWFIPVLLNPFTLLVPFVILAVLGFLGSMLGRSLAKIIDLSKNPPEE